MGIEAGFFQQLQADAIRFLLVRPGEIQLPLYIASLYAGDGGFRYLRIGACGKYREGDGCHRDQAAAALRLYHALQVVLRDVRNLVA